MNDPRGIPLEAPPLTVDDLIDLHFLLEADAAFIDGMHASLPDAHEWLRRRYRTTEHGQRRLVAPR